MDNGKLGKFLAELRKEKGLTQEQLAELINSDNKTISKWETGRYTPSVDYITKLSKLYDISTVEIMQCKRNDEESNSKEKDKNLLENMAKYNSITKRKTISLFGIVVLIISICFTFTIYTIKNKEWKVQYLTEDNDKYNIEGSIIYNNSKYIILIKRIDYEAKYIGTSLEPKITDIEITVYCNNDLVLKRNDTYDNPTFIHKALQNIFLLEEVNKQSKNNNDFRITITYTEDNKNVNTEIISLINK